MKKIFLIGSVLLTLSIGSFANSKGKMLFMQKCATCHSLSFPKNKSDMIAPPAPGVMFHMHQRFDSNDKILSYMRDFVMNPSKKTSLKKETKRFGLMPSQKGNITKDELDTVTKWMVENIHMNKKQHKMVEAKYKKQ
jgi:cytochrome c